MVETIIAVRRNLADVTILGGWAALMLGCAYSGYIGYDWARTAIYASAFIFPAAWILFRSDGHGGVYGFIACMFLLNATLNIASGIALTEAFIELVLLSILFIVVMSLLTRFSGDGRENGEVTDHDA